MSDDHTPTAQDIGLTSESVRMMRAYWDFKQPKEEALRHAEQRQMLQPGRPKPLRCHHDNDRRFCAECKRET